MNKVDDVTPIESQNEIDAIFASNGDGKGDDEDE